MYTQLQLRDSDRPPVTLNSLGQMKQRGEKIACLTSYDASFAALEDAAGVDVVLVGDTLGMVIQGHDTTVPVTMDHMVYHSAAVARALQRPFLITDMPFMSYPSRELALANAVRLMQEGGARMVKLESGKAQTDIVEFLASRMLEDALALEAAGADLVLLECIPAALGRTVTQALKVPVIGIGAGPDTDGQILVLYDILDITSGRMPRFVRKFMAGSDSPRAAVERYVQAVKSGAYPAPEHCF
jgi:3-methyl-2-oxobutanoate hydroxymethyltransferase